MITIINASRNALVSECSHYVVVGHDLSGEKIKKFLVNVVVGAA